VFGERRTKMSLCYSIVLGIGRKKMEIFMFTISRPKTIMDHRKAVDAKKWQNELASITRLLIPHLFQALSQTRGHTLWRIL
jgi:hypothetical protein